MEAAASPRLRLLSVRPMYKEEKQPALMTAVSRLLVRYGIAVISVGFVLTLRLALITQLGAGVPFLMFAAATIISFHMGGRGPAVLAALLGGVAARQFFMVPQHIGNPLWLVFYWTVSAVLIAVLDGQRRQRQRAEAALAEVNRHQETLRRQSALIELSPDAIISFDQTMIITGWNCGAGKLYGWAAAEAIGKPIDSLLRKDSAEGTAELIGSKGYWEGELVHRRRDDTEIVVESRLVPLRNHDGQLEHFLEIDRDITGRKMADAALRESALRERAHAAELEAILEAVPAIAFIARDSECRYITGSASTYRLLRMPPGSNLSTIPLDGKTPPFRMKRNGVDIPADELPMQKAARTGEAVQNVEFDVALSDGECHVLLGDAVPMRDAHGIVHGVIGVFLDITGRKQEEERLRATQKLESLGLLAGGIAHDFNNLLTGIMGHASLLEEKVMPANREYVEVILRSARRATDLTRQLLAYAGKGRFVLQHVDVSTAVREITQLLRVSIPKTIEMHLDLENNLPRVEADPGQIHQVVMNLVVNGAEAIRDNEPGSVSIRTSVATVKNGDVVRNDSSREPLSPGEYVCLEVSDTGAGMDLEQKTRIFDPFFTTKFTGRGLGLSAVAGILRSHGGGIQVASVPGRGSSFRVFLPAVKGAAPSVAGSGGSVARHGSGRILVIDDEEIVLSVASGGLRAHGFEVLTAKDGREGVEVFERNADRIDLVLLDMTMPVMSGVEAFELLKSIRPSVDVMLMSGHSESEARQSFAGREFSAFIQKPFTVRELAHQVMGAMERIRRTRPAGGGDTPA